MQKTSASTGDAEPPQHKEGRPRSAQPCSGAAEDGGRAPAREDGPRTQRGRPREGLRGLRAAPGAACSRRGRGSRRCRPLRLYRACMPKTEMVPVPVRSSFRWPCCRMCRTCCRYCGSPPSRPLDGSSAAGMAGRRRHGRSPQPGALRLSGCPPVPAEPAKNLPSRAAARRGGLPPPSPPPPGGPVSAASCSGKDAGRPLSAPAHVRCGVRAARAAGQHCRGSYRINVLKRCMLC